ncbi:MAG: 4-hydroxyphenylpyruvate dioxygenase [Acidimicrobiia bacterium]|nr:4-hydroxyphenylpyruvate dioxygenase [Acidimicrobiia bacterium]
MTAVDPQARVAPPHLRGIDHVELWVGNARAFAGWMAAAFGFDIVAHAGPETGERDRQRWMLQQGDIRLLVTGALGPDSPVADHVRRHGDGVRDIAFLVDDVDTAYAGALERGAAGVRPPADDTDDHGTIRHAAIATYGETVHTFLDRSRYAGPFAPRFEEAGLKRPVGPDVGLLRIDHIVGNVEEGELERWVGYYEQVMGFDQLVHFTDDAISTEYSALMSTVVWNGAKVVMPLNEPAEGRRKSQIEEYLDYYGSPGVQHLALRTDDIVAAVRALRARGVRMLEVPPSYYDEAKERMAELGDELPWAALAELGILVDRDHDGYLLQIFTETLCDRPTVFVEIIQREGAKGFGEGNFKALFQAIEREQEARGNL